MRSITLILFFTALILVSCEKDIHKIRFRNEHTAVLTNVKAGPVNFGTVETTEMTPYYEITQGEHRVSGNAAIGYLEGKFSITGSGEHNWILTVNKDLVIELLQEK